MERIGRGESISRSCVESELKKRDMQDQTRSLAPLKPSDDSKIIDSTELSREEVVEKILGLLKNE